ncbi:hypothetical protein DFP72DRAFT_923403 [Ephemerocybe angulata]|uniref:Uncharacterized protein n=1 Tax=Ephemerocybe angulata TaxID=980116 RepID=A0A8H6HFU0_9AGAR|nr:hypothetical protein DFP72DRAFT_923403 [Tulosesus angulatus]
MGVLQEAGETGPLYNYFASAPFKGFRYGGTDPTRDFERLCRHLVAKKVAFYPRRHGYLYQRFHEALRDQFILVFGSDIDDRRVWVKLAQRIGTYLSASDSLEYVRDAVWNTHVNLVDVMNPGIPDGQIRKFSTLEALINYSLVESRPLKMFLRDTDRMSLLSCLLRRMPDDPAERQVFEEAGPGGPLYDFFAKYNHRGFRYVPTDPTTEFDRLCENLGIPWGSDARDGLRKEFAEALRGQFVHIFGGDINDKVAWETLCRRAGLRPIPEDLESLQQLFIGTHTNMVDVMNESIPDGMMLTFTTVEDLSEYSFSARKIFPRGGVAKVDILSVLLRQISLYH